MPADVIVLNGGSSSSTTSIARRLPKVLPGTWVTLGVDDLIDALGEPVGDDTPIAFRSDGSIVVREGFRRAEAAWWAGLAAKGRSGVGVVFDDVFLGGASPQARLHATLVGLEVLWVGVCCAAEVAVQREAGRAEPIGGMAAPQISSTTGSATT